LLSGTADVEVAGGRKTYGDVFTSGVHNTLPIWIFGQIRLGQQLPQVNVIVFLILLATIIPVVLAQRLTRESGILRTE
jgi:ABC-type spermidine/putrescine transport system permease subunit II